MRTRTIEQEIELIVKYYAKPSEQELLRLAIENLLKKKEDEITRTT